LLVSFKPASTTGQPPDQEELYKAFIGPKNQDYYLRHFSRFDSNRKAGASWHWPAFFVTFYWFLYRKMWIHAVVYFFLPYLVMFALGIAGGALGESGSRTIGLAYLLYLAATFLIPPMYANAFYYKHCKEKISDTSSTTHDHQRRLGELSGKGGTSNVALIFVLIFVFIAVIGILAAIAIPAYQDYTARAHTSEALTVGGKAANSVADYYNQRHEVPDDLAQAGFTAQIPPSVMDLSLNSQNGIVTITMANPPIKGKTILLIPSLDSNNRVAWTCSSREIEDKYLPPQCRQQK
jgi:Tfp pilus assembly protein PilE